MRVLISLALSTLVMLGGARTALATPGTCTVQSMGVAGEFPFGIPAEGFVFDVDVDEATGTFTMMRDAWLDQFGPDGLVFGSSGGTSTALKMGADPVVGTIDAAGNVVLPDFDSTFVVSAGGGVALESTVTMNTGLTAIDLAGSPFVVSGMPLDFTTGVLEVTGIRVLPDPPLLGRATASGLRIRCQLAPIPSAAALPAAFGLNRARGKAKVDPSFEDGDAGDRLVLKAKLTAGANPPSVDGTTDVFVRISQGDETLVLLGIPAGNQTVKGKKVVVTDRDGTLIDVLEGRKATGSAASVTGGKVIVKAGKKGINLKAKVQGLDLAALPNQQLELSVAVGSQTVTGTVSANAKGKLR